MSYFQRSRSLKSLVNVVARHHRGRLLDGGDGGDFVLLLRHLRLVDILHSFLAILAALLEGTFAIVD